MRIGRDCVTDGRIDIAAIARNNDIRERHSAVRHLRVVRVAAVRESRTRRFASNRCRHFGRRVVGAIREVHIAHHRAHFLDRRARQRLRRHDRIDRLSSVRRNPIAAHSRPCRSQARTRIDGDGARRRRNLRLATARVAHTNRRVGNRRNRDRVGIKRRRDRNRDVGIGCRQLVR